MIPINRITREEAAKQYPTAPGTAERLRKRKAKTLRKRNQRKYTPPRLVDGYALTGFYFDSPRAMVMLPIRTKSEGNEREHWQSVRRRIKQQREVTAFWLTRLGRADWRTQVKRVRFVRFAPKGVRHLDQGDNTVSSSKHIRDQVAEWLAGSNVVPSGRGQGKGDDGRKAGVYWDADNHETGSAYGVRIEFFVQ